MHLYYLAWQALADGRALFFALEQRRNKEFSESKQDVTSQLATMKLWSVLVLFWLGLATCLAADYQFSQKMFKYKLRKYIEKTDNQEKMKTKPVKEETCGYAVS